METVITTPTPGEQDDERVMTLLHQHVPLALLCDLTAASGPTSREILETEGQPAERWWEQEPAS